MTQMKYARKAILFTHEGQMARLDLRQGECFLFVVKGQAPRIAPVDEPGSYEIDFEILPKGELPMLVAVLPVKDAKRFERGGAAISDDMLAQASARPIPN